ncbi:hypothetical protein B0H13DRAFT_2265166 [Mycena leptocephala]|nr:hypothetical protein B0H13DRAFT_2265166 [Mycena leptocephala]
MTLELMHPNPAFPPELEREIFETTALMYPGEMPTLLRVARRVLVWIEPLLYRVIYLTPETEEALFDAMNSKPADFFANAVRHLCLPRLEVKTRRILEVCTGVVDLAPNHLDPYVLPIIATMRLQRLSIDLHELFGGPVDLHHPLFAAITHLDLLDFPDEDHLQTLVQISILPALTHLALDYRVPRVLVETLLIECPRLALLLVLWSVHARYKSAQIPHVYDVRFVIGLCPQNYWGDWEAGAKGQSHMWSQADDFVAQKRSKTIEATRYWL